MLPTLKPNGPMHASRTSPRPGEHTPHKNYFPFFLQIPSKKVGTAVSDMQNTVMKRIGRDGGESQA
ncbi:hypothetical protein SBV1_940016 [Verrucomicrobia bacterium]|nr:hypothetical protein SBV1_940016 [Verrucomicrobiota bacterium]